MEIPLALSNQFLGEFANRGLPSPVVLPDGTFAVKLNETEFTISLENLARDFATDQDLRRVSRFVETILSTLQPLPDWPLAKAGIRFSAERSDHDFGDSLYESITDSLCRVLAYVDPGETSITWLTASMLEDWNVSREEAAAVAAENMSELLRQTPVEIEMIDRFHLGMLATNSPLKASLIFSPNFAEILAPKLGWPVFAVIPCRDFAYVFPETDRDLIGRLGRVVVEEYSNGAYPISTEVYRLSDHGVKAIGRFPVE
jgi:hypothetical protein